MYFNPNVYDFKYLKDNDKELIGVYDAVQNNVLTQKTVEEFINSKSVKGKTLQGLYEDVLTEFIAYLHEQIEYRKVDMIMEKIEEYPEDELKQNINKISSENAIASD